VRLRARKRRGNVLSKRIGKKGREKRRETEEEETIEIEEEESSGLVLNLG